MLRNLVAALSLWLCAYNSCAGKSPLPLVDLCLLKIVRTQPLSLKLLRKCKVSETMFDGLCFVLSTELGYNHFFANHKRLREILAPQAIDGHSFVSPSETPGFSQSQIDALVKTLKHMNGLATALQKLKRLQEGDPGVQKKIDDLAFSSYSRLAMMMHQPIKRTLPLHSYTLLYRASSQMISPFCYAHEPDTRQAKLSFAGIHLRGLPSILLPQGITEIDISSNEINIFPEALLGCKALRFLGIHANPMTCSPPLIKQLLSEVVHLKTLIVGREQVANVDEIRSIDSIRVEGLFGKSVLSDDSASPERARAAMYYSKGLFFRSDLSRLNIYIVDSSAIRIEKHKDSCYQM